MKFSCSWPKENKPGDLETETVLCHATKSLLKEIQQNLNLFSPFISSTFLHFCATWFSLFTASRRVVVLTESLIQSVPAFPCPTVKRPLCEVDLSPHPAPRLTCLSLYDHTHSLVMMGTDFTIHQNCLRVCLVYLFIGRRQFNHLTDFQRAK